MKRVKVKSGYYRNYRQWFAHDVLAAIKKYSLFKTTGFTRKLIDSLENVDYTNLWLGLMHRKGVKSHA